MNSRLDFDHSRHGQIGQLEDDRVYVAFERQLSHPIDKVWTAISDPDQLKHWFSGINIELKQGGSFEIWFGGDCDGPSHVSGIVEEFDPPNVMQLGSMRYQLIANDAGCLLKFSDVLQFAGPRSRQEFAVSVLGGWHAYLDKLELALGESSNISDVREPDYSEINVPGWEVL